MGNKWEFKKEKKGNNWWKKTKATKKTQKRKTHGKQKEK